MRFVDKDTAQDITQEVLFKFWKNREQHKDIKESDNFLFIMVKNETLSYLRSRKRENEQYKQLEQEEAKEQVFYALVKEGRDQPTARPRHLPITCTDRTRDPAGPLRILKQRNRHAGQRVHQHRENVEIRRGAASCGSISRGTNSNTSSRNEN